MRIIAISDLHGQLPDPEAVPKGDLLLIAGDLCPDRPAGGISQAEWMERELFPWIEDVGIDAFATYGNHDRLDGSGSFIKIDELVEYGGLKIWFSPWCQNLPRWAWNKSVTEMNAIYARIPDDIDIIVSHQPPFGYGDQIPYYLLSPNEDPDGHIGSREFLRTIDRVCPKVVICGHIHEGYGSYSHVRPDGGTTHIYNVSHVNGAYEPIHPATVIEV